MADGDKEEELADGPGGDGKISAPTPPPPSSYGNAGDNIPDLETQMQQAANCVNAQISGTGPVAGTLKHTLFKQYVDGIGNPYLRTEVSYKDGRIVSYGSSGSIRFDVALYDDFGNPLMAWDFKTGNATLTGSRIEQMRQRSGLPSIDIHMVK